MITAIAIMCFLEFAAIVWLVVRTNMHAKALSTLAAITKGHSDALLARRPGEREN